MRHTEAIPTAILLATSALAGCAEPAKAPPPPVAARPAASAATPEKPEGSAVLEAATRACDGGSPNDCNTLALAYLEGHAGARIDKARAARIFERGCELGGAAACGNLGYLFTEGIGVEKDVVRAIGLMTQACDGTFWESCRLLGDIYFDGDHEDLPRAFALVDRACKGGNQRGCASSAILLSLGKGVTKDLERALPLSEGACAAGVDYGCTALGNVLFEQKADATRIRAAYEKGCTEHNPEGCFAIGELYASGSLGKEGVARAPGMFRRACDLGLQPACAKLKRAR